MKKAFGYSQGLVWKCISLAVRLPITEEINAINLKGTWYERLVLLLRNVENYDVIYGHWRCYSGYIAMITVTSTFAYVKQKYK